MRRITTLACSTAMLAAAGWIATAHAQSAAPDTSAPAADSSAPPAADTSAPAEAPKPVKHHHAHKASSSPKAEGGDAAVEDLNAKSLDDAKAGKSFAPPTPTPAAAPAKKPHHHHWVKKAPEAPPADAPAPDAAPK